MVERQIDAGEWFILLAEDQALATVRLAWSDPHIWPGNQPAGYIHGLMVSRTLAGTGLGANLLTWAEQRILAMGKTLARLDAAHPRLLAYYRRHGYHGAGTFGSRV
jgi:GNAT superfamily N-acetyltransferase